MQALAGIFFEMQASDSNPLAGSITAGNLKVTVLGDWLVILRDLVSLGQVRIEVVLAGKD